MALYGVVQRNGAYLMIKGSVLAVEQEAVFRFRMCWFVFALLLCAFVFL
jgi:hypothetical protein